MGEDSNPVPAPGPLEEAGASSPPARIRVFLADDHAVVREGLALLLEESGQFEVVGQCGDGREVVALVEAVHPDVVVLDIHMPGLNGIDVCGELVRRNRRTLVLMLSVREEEPFILRALESG
ncbi:MAG: response regulator transcription factor, partial [Planctomycetota bacterium]|nr:response regulator transcription factor [Planctomycetota bacterium]